MLSSEAWEASVDTTFMAITAVSPSIEPALVALPL